MPSKDSGVCCPEACTQDGLCVAENADGSGAARVFAGRNDDLRDYDWGNRARYLAYIGEVHEFGACFESSVVVPKITQLHAPGVLLAVGALLHRNPV